MGHSYKTQNTYVSELAICNGVKSKWKRE